MIPKVVTFALTLRRLNSLALAGSEVTTAKLKL